MPKLTAILSVLLILSAILSCTGDIPSEPINYNPLDQDNPDTHGDPYNLQIEIADGGAHLTWDLFDWGPLTGFSIYRKQDNASFNLLTKINATTTTYTDISIQNGHRYGYYIVARCQAGDFQHSEYVTIAINTDPVLFIEGEFIEQTSTRNVTLTILAFGATQMQLSNDSAFAGASWEAISPTKQWQLESDVGTKTAYLRVTYENEEISTTVSDDIMPAPILPTVVINNNEECTDSKITTITLTGTGATEMRIVNIVPANLSVGNSSTAFIDHQSKKITSKNISEVEHPNRDETNEDWLPFEESIEWELLTGGDLKRIEVIVRNDFLIEEVCADDILPRLSEALNLTIGDTDTVQTNHVEVRFEAEYADSMQISSNENFSVADWIPYQPSFQWDLGNGSIIDETSSILSTRQISRLPGPQRDATERTVYAKVKNDFEVESGVVSDDVVVEIFGTVVINNNDEFAQSRAVSIQLNAHEADSVALSNNFDDIANNPNWQVYSDNVEWTLLVGTDQKTVYVRFKNESGAESGVYSDDIQPLPIDPSLEVNDDDGYSPIRLIDLNLSADGENLRMMLSEDPDFTNVDWVNFAESPQFELSTGAGEKIVYGKFINDFEIESGVVSDATEPLPMNSFISIENGAEFTSARDVIVLLSVDGLIDSMQVSIHEDFNDISWIDFAEEVNIELSTGEDDKVVYARFANDFEIVSETVSDDIQPLPIDPSLEVNDDDGYTPFRLVDLNLSADGENLRMMLSEDPDFTNVDWVNFAESPQFELSTGAGEKIVYGKFVNDFEIESGVVSDATEPLPMNSSISIDNGAEFTSARDVIVLLSADGLIDSMQVSIHEDFNDVEWIDFTEEVNIELSTGEDDKVVYARFVNDFEIESDVVSDTISPSPLHPNLTINDGADITNNSVLQLSMLDVGALEMQVSEEDDFGDVDWIDYVDEIDLDVADGSSTVYARFRNDFFVSDPVSDNILVDTRVEIDEFFWSSEENGPYFAGDVITFILVMSNDNIGAEIGGIAIVSIEDVVDDVELEEVGVGRYELEYELDEGLVVEGEVTVSFTDRAGNATQATADDLIDVIPEAGYERDFQLTDDVSITMVFIPAGDFEMGSPDDEDGHSGNEGPVHDVTFAEGFWLGKYELTQSQWEAVMNDNPAHDYGVGENHPVYYVSWDDIQGFEESLDDEFRLPSESEWEYACRAGTDTRFYWGEDPDYDDIDDYAVYSDNDPGGTAEVGTKEPNAWGLYDMSGNVYEWCEDRWHGDYGGAPEDGSPWLDNPVGSDRVRRGGSWGNNARLCRSANRDCLDPSDRNYALGFRLARSL